MLTQHALPFELARTLSFHGERLHDFLFRPGMFATENEAELFYEALLDQACNENDPVHQIKSLRQVYHQNCCQTAGRYVADDANRKQQLVAQMLGTLSANGRPLGFPDGPAPRSLLDIGCGNGAITSALAAHWNIPTSRAIGTDLMRPANLPGNITFRRMEPDTLPANLPHRGYDLAVVALVLHHAANPEALVQQIVSVLSPGGLMVVREHSAYYPYAALVLNTFHVLYEQVFAARAEPLENAQNYRSVAEWKFLFKNAGLKIVKLDYTPYELERKNTSSNFTLVAQKPAR